MAQLIQTSVAERQTATAKPNRAAHFVIGMLSPSIVIILFVVAFPLIYSFYLSFTSFNLLRPSTTWNNFANYQRLLQDPIFGQAFINTLLFMFVTINAAFLIGLLLSQIIARTARGQSALRTLLMVPMMFAPVMVGFQFRWFFNDQVGLVNNVLTSLGLLQGSIPWLVDRWLAMFAIGVATVWMNTPIVAIILLAGTLSISPELYEAADVDGANSWQKFRAITYPLLGPFITIALTILSLDVARGFDIVSIMTGGGPAHRTELLWTYVPRVAIQDSKFAQGAAMSFVTVIVTLGFTVYLFRQLLKSRIL